MILEELKAHHRSPRQLKAIALLQHPESYPGLAPWRAHDTRVSFVRLPAFQPYSVWALQHRDTLCQVRCVEWDRGADYTETFPESASTTFGADALRLAGAVRGILDELASLSSPLFLPVPVTVRLDGISFGISFGDAARSACLSWWGEPPEAWRPLVPCYEHAVALFEHHLPLGTVGNPLLQTGAQPRLAVTMPVEP